MTPGQHLQAISAAFFCGGGWVDALTWDDYDDAGRAMWEAYAQTIGRNIRAAAAAPDLLAGVREAVCVLDLADEYGFYEPGSLGDADVSDCRDQLRAAHVKATGRYFTPVEIELGADERLAPETPTPAVLAPEGTEDGRSNSPGIDPEKAALRQRVRGLEEALRPFANTPIGEGMKDHWPINYRPVTATYRDVLNARALLPLPEGGFGGSSRAESGISPAAPARTETTGQAGKGEP